MTDIARKINRRAFLKTTGAAGLLTAGALVSPASSLAAPATPAANVGGVEDTITAAMESTGIPGATVLIQQADAAPWVRSYGLADIESGTPMDPAMHMRIGSITKTMTATAILQLVDAGTLSLDDTLAGVMPDLASFPHAGEMTIKHLLSMQSGAFNYLDDEAVFMQMATDPTRSWTAEEIIDTTLSHDPYFAPGEDFSYSNTNYILLGMILANATDLSEADALDRRVFAPLGLEDTSLPEETGLPTPFARGYGLDITASTATPTADAMDALKDWTELNPTMAGTAGGVVSTVSDLHVWLQEMMQGSLLSEALQNQRMTFEEVKLDSGGPTFGYGLGVANFDGLVGHDGSIFGYDSFMGQDPGSGTSIITLINVSPSAGASAAALAMSIRAALER